MFQTTVVLGYLLRRWSDFCMFGCIIQLLSRESFPGGCLVVHECGMALAGPDYKVILLILTREDPGRLRGLW